MCLLSVSWQVSERYPLVIAGNRDEFRDRPSEDAHWWETRPPLLAGRDAESGGTWLGMTRRGRFAIVTNFRDLKPRKGNVSRGRLVTDFLLGRRSPAQFAKYLETVEREYAGFNLLYGDRKHLFYFSNRGIGIGELRPGTYAVSNALLNTPWPKVKQARAVMETAVSDDGVDTDALLALMQDRTQPPDEELPHVTLPLEQRRVIAAPFIVGRQYGTRCTTIITVRDDRQVAFMEQRYGKNSRVGGRSEFSFRIA
jgi:uncharacterized protein with NRDE domain